MVKFVTSTDTAEPAFVAMEYLLLLRCVVEEVAFVAEICTDGRLARGARSRDRLACVTNGANHLLYGIPVHLVVRFLIVAERTRRDHAATRRDDAHTQLVMVARDERR
jgi:hypothetical protein